MGEHLSRKQETPVRFREAAKNFMEEKILEIENKIRELFHFL